MDMGDQIWTWNEWTWNGHRIMTDEQRAPSTLKTAQKERVTGANMGFHVFR